MEITSVIVKPRLTEKTQSMKNFKNPKMAFIVNKHANKYQIALAFKALFGVESKSVNVLNRKPSPARFMNKSRKNYYKAFKIALITVKSQDFENLQNKALAEVKNPTPELEAQLTDGN